MLTLRMTIIQEKETNFIQQKIGRDSGRTLVYFKQIVLNVRGYSQSKEVTNEVLLIIIKQNRFK